MRIRLEKDYDGLTRSRVGSQYHIKANTVDILIMHNEKMPKKFDNKPTFDI
jgi:hypothetical protein